MLLKPFGNIQYR